MEVLIVEDNVDLCANMCDFLESREHTIDAVRDGINGLKAATEHNYDVIVLDVSLPKIDGVEICRKLRSEFKSSIPILMLTAKSDLADKLHGFESGADDYLVKPFSLSELEARLHALTKRARRVAGGKVLRVADLTMNLETHKVERAGHPITMTRMELKILEILMRQTHRVVSKKELEKLVWQSAPLDSDALRVHIHRLRNAIDKPFEHALIRTVHGIGYRLVEPEGIKK